MAGSHGGKLLENGYIQIYTGDGKGKTTASLGLAFRALGHGWKVLIIQFTKGDKGTTYGEIASSGRFANLEVRQYGLDRVVYSHNMNMDDYKECKKGWEYAKQAIQSGEYGLIILDEINICLDMGMLKVSDVKNTLINKPKNLEIVLTGRRAPQELVALAHLVTEMQPIKHYFDVGVMARRGIEY
ncbi:MAG: cob(I)yrinic acid a,c-diamide adenosyltransferase [Cyanobacteria bacterium SIG30]|nr:cob(I)yrinic acid a,c-diamide adenosyltransferase [Cyanobacteria bacterium SIG30]